jgi:crotonobetainyl-CoA:carnitine CoA-transferase CaiB-like acyl-CoA transferase
LKAVPDLGEHTAMILAELGYAPNDIERLGEEGVV